MKNVHDEIKKLEEICRTQQATLEEQQQRLAEYRRNFRAWIDATRGLKTITGNLLQAIAARDEQLMAALAAQVEAGGLLEMFDSKFPNLDAIDAAQQIGWLDDGAEPAGQPG